MGFEKNAVESRLSVFLSDKGFPGPPRGIPGPPKGIPKSFLDDPENSARNVKSTNYDSEPSPKTIQDSKILL